MLTCTQYTSVTDPFGLRLLSENPECLRRELCSSYINSTLIIFEISEIDFTTLAEVAFGRHKDAVTSVVTLRF